MDIQIHPDTSPPLGVFRTKHRPLKPATGCFNNWISAGKAWMPSIWAPRNHRFSWGISSYELRPCNVFYGFYVMEMGLSCCHVPFFGGKPLDFGAPKTVQMLDL